MRVVIGDLLTGRRLLEVPFTKARWSLRRNRPGTVEVDVPVYDPTVQALGLRNAATPRKSFIAVSDGGWIAEAGQLGDPSYSRDKGTVTLSAPGLLAYFGHRNVLPPVAYTATTTGFLIPDPAEPTKTIPNPAYGTSFSGWSLGTIIKLLVEQSLGAPNGNLPIVLPANIPGIHERNYEVTDIKSLEQAIYDICAVIGGPDVMLVPRMQADQQGVEWLLRTGTDEQPLIRSQSVHFWDLTDGRTDTRNLDTDPDSSKLASVSWATGGRSTGTAIVERATDSTLTSAGYPLMEIVDTSHTDVSVRSTLHGHAVANLASRSAEVWTFEVKKDSEPKLGSYGIGDLCRLEIEGDPYIPNGTYTREIAAMSGDETDWVKLTVVEAA